MAEYQTVDAALESEGPGAGANFMLLVFRVLIGSVFVFSGLAKLGFAGKFGAPTDFAVAIANFKLLHHDLIPFATFAIPWTEVICGTALILGLCSRGAAMVVNVLLLAFSAGMATLVARGMVDVECTCFGGQLTELFGEQVGEWLEPKVGWKSFVRNGVFLMITIPVAMWGGGMLALDRLIGFERKG